KGRPRGFFGTASVLVGGGDFFSIFVSFASDLNEHRSFQDPARAIRRVRCRTAHPFSPRVQPMAGGEVLRSSGNEGFETDYNVFQTFDAKLSQQKIGNTSARFIYTQIRVFCNY